MANESRNRGSIIDWVVDSVRKSIQVSKDRFKDLASSVSESASDSVASIRNFSNDASSTVSNSIRNLFSINAEGLGEAESAHDSFIQHLTKSYEGFTENLREGFDNLGGNVLSSLPFAGIVSSAIDLQHDLKGIVETTGGYLTDSFKRVQGVVTSSVSQFNLGQDEIIEMVLALNSLNKGYIENEATLSSMIHTTRSLSKVLDLNADEAAQLVHQFVLLGFSQKRIEDLSSSVYNLLRNVGFAGKDVVEIINRTTNQAKTLQLIGADAISKYQEGVTKAIASVTSLGHLEEEAKQGVLSFFDVLSDSNNMQERHMAMSLAGIRSMQDFHDLLRKDPGKLYDRVNKGILSMVQNIALSNGTSKEWFDASNERVERLIDVRAGILAEQTGMEKGFLEESVRLYRQKLVEHKDLLVKAGIDENKAIELAMQNSKAIMAQALTPPELDGSDWERRLGVSIRNIKDQFNKVVTAIHQIVSHLGTPIVEDLVKPMTWLAESMRKLGEFVGREENAGLVEAISKALLTITALFAAGTIMKGFMFLGKSILMISKVPLAPIIFGLKALIKGAGLLIGLVPKLGTVIAAATRLAFGPWGIAIGLIVSAFTFLEVKFGIFSKAWKWLVGFYDRNIAPVFESLFNFLDSLNFGNLGEKAKEAFSGISNYVSNLSFDNVGNQLTKVGNSISQWVSDLDFGNLGQKLSNVTAPLMASLIGFDFGKVRDFFSSGWDKATSVFKSEKVNKVLSGLKGSITVAVEGLKNINLEGLQDKLSTKVVEVKTSLSKVGKEFRNNVKETFLFQINWDKVTENMSEKFSDITSSISSYFSKAFTGLLESASSIWERVLNTFNIQGLSKILLKPLDGILVEIERITFDTVNKIGQIFDGISFSNLSDRASKVWEDIKKLFSFDFFRDKISSISFEGLLEKASSIWERIKNLFSFSFLKDAFISSFEGIVEEIVNIWEIIKSKFTFSGLFGFKGKETKIEGDSNRVAGAVKSVLDSTTGIFASLFSREKREDKRIIVPTTASVLKSEQNQDELLSTVRELTKDKGKERELGTQTNPIVVEPSKREITTATQLDEITVSKSNEDKRREDKDRKEAEKRAKKLDDLVTTLSKSEVQKEELIKLLRFALVGQGGHIDNKQLNALMASGVL